MFKERHMRVLKLEVLRRKFNTKWVSKMYKTGKHRGRRKDNGELRCD